MNGRPGPATTRVVLLGPPGAGKGTQGARLAARLGVPHVSTGDLFREARSSGTPTGREAAGYMARGLLVPDEVVIGLVRERLGRTDAREGFLLDGFPRTTAQADALARLAAPSRVVALGAPEEALIARLAGRRTCRVCRAPYHASSFPADGRCPKDGGDLVQRDDDREEAVRRRLAEYRDKTAPLLDYYRARGLLLEVDGVGRLEEVTERVARAVSA